LNVSHWKTQSQHLNILNHKNHNQKIGFCKIVEEEFFVIRRLSNSLTEADWCFLLKVFTETRDCRLLHFCLGKAKLPPNTGKEKHHFFPA